MSNNKPIGADDDVNAPFNQDENEYECSECGKSLSSDIGNCGSKNCLKSAML